jgi:hypothetical protein
VPLSTAAGEFTKNRFKLSLIACLIFFACSTPAIKLTHSTVEPITQINLRGVRYSRPTYPVANENNSTESKTHELKCIVPLELWNFILVSPQTKSLLVCLHTLSEDAHYFYISKTQPELKIDASKSAKNSCLVKYLPVIPLPREIYFLALAGQNKNQEVYSMSFETESTSTHKIVFKFPLSMTPNTPSELELWLMTSIFNLFQDEGQMLASQVTDDVTAACFDEDVNFIDKKNAKIAPAYWP